MFQFGGEDWKQWNKKMRDWLIKQQDKKGHATGSWTMTRDLWQDCVDQGSVRGGRLYCTTPSLLILETYYKHARLPSDVR